WSPVKKFTFNPVSGHIIGIYNNGAVFKWHPVTGEHTEGPLAQSAAFDIATSPDGKSFATSSLSGTIKIWSFAHLSVVYKLPRGDPLTDFTFAPGCKRLYDIRFSTMNAWEPNGLRRVSEIHDSPEVLAEENQLSICEPQTSD